MTTKEQMFLIADLARTVRTGWDTRGVIAALEPFANRDVTECVWAALTAAQNDQNRSPITIANDENWPRTPEIQAELDRQNRLLIIEMRTRAAARCIECDERGYLPSGQRCPHDPDLAERAAKAKERADWARARIRPGPQRIDRPPDETPAQPCRHCGNPNHTAPTCPQKATT